ncbi:MAG TPA: PfkB family carbohydrate kinase, partial [Agromyces sp.]
MLRDRAAFAAAFEAVAAHALLVKVGDEDADLLLGASLDVFAERLRAASAGDRDASRVRPLAVLATAGRDGATLHHGDLRVHAGIVALPGPIVDTMGAGDATLSAVTHHIGARGLPGEEASWSVALDTAMTVAAATVRHEGALLRTPHAVGSVDSFGS